jgi:hypothetical protein
MNGRFKKNKSVCVANNLKFHLMELNLNALVVKTRPKEFVNCLIFPFVCQRTLVPIGSVLLADKAIHLRLRIRKILGGGMRQGDICCSWNLCFRQCGTSCRRS